MAGLRVFKQVQDKYCKNILSQENGFLTSRQMHHVVLVQRAAYLLVCIKDKLNLIVLNENSIFKITFS